MNGSEELERRLGAQLHHQVDGMGDAPLGLDDVKGTARRIRRNRRIAGGVAVAAVLAVAVPTALAIGPDLNRSDTVPPATDPTPTTTETVLSLDGLETGGSPLVEYFDVDGVVLPDRGSVPVDGSYQALVEDPASNGWLAVSPSRDELVDLTSDFGETSARAITQALVVTPDRGKVAFVAVEAGAQTLVVRDTTDAEAGQVWDLAVGLGQPVGFLDGDRVLYANTVGSKGPQIGVAEADGTTRTLEPGFLRAIATDPTTGRATVMTEAKDDGSGCFAVVDLTTGNGSTKWETCDYSLGTFSPDGKYVLASDPYQSGYGKPSLSILDSDTGDRVASFVPRSRGDQTPLALVQTAWEDADSVLVVATEGPDAALLRLGADGTAEAAVPTTPIVGDVPLWLGMDRTQNW